MYRKLTDQQIEDLNLHTVWLKTDGKEGEQLNWSGQDLRYVDLRRVNLSYADLEDADLQGADLQDADLEGADLSGVNLKHCIGDGIRIKNTTNKYYIIVYTDTVMAIGCKQHSLKEWFNFTDDEILKMDGEKALTFWKEWDPKLIELTGYKE